MADLRGVLLDVDGTLIDSNDAHASAWVRALQEHGYTVPFESVRRMIGMGGDKLLPAVTGGLDAESDVGKQIGERRREVFLTEYLPRLQPTDGARALLERLRADGLRLVVASSAQEDELQPLLERAGVADLIEARASSDDADRSKPDPDIIHAALQQARLEPNDVVLLGDTPYDIEAAEKADVATVAVRCGGWSTEKLSGAIAVYDDPSDVLKDYDSSVFARPR
jgi:HAD superfamily hydrolase (TIGR01509 family)